MKVQELRNLLEGVTKGEWSTINGAVLYNGAGSYVLTDADRFLIVAAVNALPALLDVVEAADDLLVKMTSEYTPEEEKQANDHLRAALARLENS